MDCGGEDRISSMLLRFLTWSPGGMLSRMGELKNLKRNPPFFKSPLTFLKAWLAKIFFLWVCHSTRAGARPFFFNALSKSLCGFFIIRGPFDPIKPIKTPSEAFTLDFVWKSGGGNEQNRVKTKLGKAKKKFLQNIVLRGGANLVDQKRGIRIRVGTQHTHL